MLVCDRRERIYPFRLGNDFIWAILNGKILDNTVGRVDHFLFNEPRMFISLSERINPFPTKHPDKFQFVNMFTKTDNLKAKFRNKRGFFYEAIQNS